MTIPPTPDRTDPLAETDSDSPFAPSTSPAPSRDGDEPGPRVVTVPPGRLQPDDPRSASAPEPPRLPPASDLSAETVSVLLWELVHWLADEHVFLELTDHLSDLELYEFLRGEIVDPTLFPDDGMTLVSPIYGWSEEDCRTYVRYYCPEDKRSDWEDLFAGEEMPPLEKPPYDRDRFLPVWRIETTAKEPPRQDAGA